MSRYKKKVSPSDPEVNQRVSTGMACKPAPPLPPLPQLAVVQDEPVGDHHDVVKQLEGLGRRLKQRDEARRLQRVRHLHTQQNKVREALEFVVLSL